MSNKQNRIVITGGNGFIGSHITSYFIEKGEDITSPSSSRLNVCDRNALKHAFSGVDTVIHNAAKATDWGAREDFFKINVQGTQNVLKACHENQVSQIIMTGSCSVFGEEHCLQVKDENSPKNSHYPYFLDKLFPCAMNYYRDSKRDAVCEAIALAEELGLNLTILHPVWVYGEREFHTGFYTYLKTVQDRIPAIMGSRKNIFPVIYAGDLAKAYYLAYQAGLTGALNGVHEYIAGDREAISMDRLYQIFCQTAGLKKPPNLPKALLYPPALVLELLGTVFKSKEPPLLTRGRINMFYDSIAYCTDKIRKDLGFSCEYSLEEGVAKTVKWYQDEGYL